MRITANEAIKKFRSGEELKRFREFPVSPHKAESELQRLTDLFDGIRADDERERVDQWPGRGRVFTEKSGARTVATYQGNSEKGQASLQYRVCQGEWVRETVTQETVFTPGQAKTSEGENRGCPAEKPVYR